jgi:ABC-2 type transport system permease protein
MMALSVTAAWRLSLRRIWAMLLRHLYLFRASWPRLFDLIYWPTVQLVMWGFLQVFLARESSFFANTAGLFIGAVLLWDILFRAQLGFAVSFLEEIYSRNLGHLLASPLRPFEFVIALICMSVIRVSIGLFPVTLLAMWFFGFNVYSMGLWLVAFFFNLVLTSWAFGLFVSGILLRFGLGAENIAWSLMFIMLPLACVYYPLDTLPLWLQYFAVSLAPTHVFEGMRALLLEGTVEPHYMWRALGLNVIYFAAGSLSFAYFLKDARRRGTLVGMGE